MRYVVIVAGGSGTRLWPLSRRGMPKQLLPVLGGRSLLRLAYERLDGVVPPERVWVCTGAAYADLVAAELPEVPRAQVLGEPEGRDSLNAMAWPAAVLAGADPDAVVATVTADHVIEPVPVFRDALDRAFAVAESDPSALVTFGVVPTSPHTGFGYLRRGAPVPGHDDDVVAVAAFTEKPDAATASHYLASGEYWWNAGMFVWRARTFLDQLRVLLPADHARVTELAAHPDRLASLYPQLTRTSVDYGVLEPVAAGAGTAHVLAVRLPVQWHDVGGFAALAEHLPRDGDGNATTGTSVLLDARDNLVVNTAGDGRVVAVVGLAGTVVVSTPEITLVCPVDQAERVKELVATVTARLGTSYA